MNKRKIFAMFYRFLKDEGVLDKFIANLRRGSMYYPLGRVRRDTTDKKLLINYVLFVFSNSTDPNNKMLSRSFNWSGSPEGDGFWRSLDNRWRNKISSNDR